MLSLADRMVAVLSEGSGLMATVSPYHTNSLEYLPKHREVYHDKDSCPDGKRIKPQHRESGTGNKKHCEECYKVS